MLHTIGGQDPVELRNAFSALYGVRSSAQLEAVLREHPVTRSPVFAALRQDYLKLRSDRAPSFAAFRHLYADFFWRLHQEAHEARCARVAARPAAARRTVPEQPIPILLTRILQLWASAFLM